MRLATLLDQLNAAYAEQADNHVAICERILAEIADLDDPACVGPLMLFFDDEAEYGELMWSVLHLIEHVGGDGYVPVLVQRLPAMKVRAPGWAETLVLRLLNAPDELPGLVAAGRNAEPEAREALIEIVTSLAARNERFMEPAAVVLSGLTAG